MSRPSSHDRCIAAHLTLILAALLLTTAARLRAEDAVEQAPPSRAPHWIWPTKDREKGQIAIFRTGFLSPAELKSARLYVIGDAASVSVWINGLLVAAAEPYGPMVEADVTSLMHGRDDLLEIRSTAAGDSPAINVRLTWSDREGRKGGGGSFDAWFARIAPDFPTDWPQGNVFRPAGVKWDKAVSFGTLEEEPWGHTEDRIAIKPFDDYEQWRQATGAAEGADPASFQVTPGFEIERLRSAAKDEGSWVSMTFDPKGRLIIAREDKGLLRLTLPADAAGKIDAKAVRVETINDTLHECRGLLFIGDDLYANANNDKTLVRLRDTTGDDRFDEITKVLELPGGVGHGRNDITRGPDGALYAIQGDSVALPKDMASRLSPLRFAGRPKAGEGFVYRFDPRAEKDGSATQIPRFELLAAGLRNPYGIAFNKDGEAFTYDADAEHDMGAPWYRPTRVRHLVSGADFGWRAVTGAWPPYYPDAPDSPPSTFDIGKGSPTAIAFGTGSAFPGKYQEALYILDWAYGRILAVHMTPRGASYACSAETFVKGRPFNVTDLAFGPDGAMYVTTGGRKTQSGLYRIRYTGPVMQLPEKSEQQKAREAHAKASRELRHKLQAMHKKDAAAVDFAWPHLHSDDPWIRHAARIAIEHQPVEQWRERALHEESTAGLEALMALAAASKNAEKQAIIERLRELPLGGYSAPQKLLALRVYELCIAGGDLKDGLKRQIADRLTAMYPGSTWEVNRSLSLLLAELGAPELLPRTLPLLGRATRQEEQLHYLFVLRNVKQGWSLDDRKLYFRKLLETEKYRGGAGMPGFIKKIREEAVATLSEAERTALGDLIEGREPALPAIPQRDFVKAWKLDDLADAFANDTGRRDLRNGRAMFNAAACNRCHRFGDEGRSVGPDLTNVASRFSRHDMLQSIIEPSAVVAEPYRNMRIEKDDGEVIVGLVVMAGDYRASELRIAPNLMEPEKVLVIPKKAIVSHAESKVSPMPEGLLNTLSREDILDLLAFLETGGAKK